MLGKCPRFARSVATENNVLSQMTIMNLSICPVLPLNPETTANKAATRPRYPGCCPASPPAWSPARPPQGLTHLASGIELSGLLAFALLFKSIKFHLRFTS